MERLALFDFDNVIYKGHSVFDVIQAQEDDGYIERGVWANVEEELVRYKKQEVSYKEAADKMLAYWARGLKGKSYTGAVEYIQTYFDAHPDKFFGWFGEVSAEIKQSHDVLIVTTNYQFIADAVVQRFGLTGYLSSIAQVEDGIFTGKIEKSLAGNKGEVIGLLEQYPKETTIAVGDSENDIDMLANVGIPICFQPDKKLRAAAKKNNWIIVDNESIIATVNELLLR